jgi:16S rRNA U1498 N3-methylase RsmE
MPSKTPRPAILRRPAALALALVAALALAAQAAPIDIVFGPEGGFAPSNNERTFVTKAGNTERCA